MIKQSKQRLRVSYAQCAICRVIAEYYYDLDSNESYELAFVENCIKCDASPTQLFQVTITRGAN
jgi:hypothetical protein